MMTYLARFDELLKKTNLFPIIMSEQLVKHNHWLYNKCHISYYFTVDEVSVQVNQRLELNLLSELRSFLEPHLQLSLQAKAQYQHQH
jgi:hypothetical protein